VRGSNLFFLAFIHPGHYYLRGWFEVGEKINYVEALRRFPNRRNVIIRTLPNGQTVEAITRTRQTKWRYPKRKQSFEHSHLTSIPSFLFSTNSDNTIYIQNPEDDHEIDNWKCNRIFHCTDRQFSQCISQNFCSKEGTITANPFQQYVVAHPKRWFDVGELRINWHTIESEFHFGFTPQTPAYQHNALKTPQDKVHPLLEFLNQRKTAANTPNNDAPSFEKG